MGADCSPPSRQARGPRTTGGRQPGLPRSRALIARTGAPWRDLSDPFGLFGILSFGASAAGPLKGVFESLFEALSSDLDFEYTIIDGTIVRVHQHGSANSRIVAPAGRMRLSADGVVRDTGLPDLVAPSASQHLVEDLPAETLIFLLGSRYCETDRLSDVAWNLFEKSPLGWARVQAICDFVHCHIAFGYGCCALASAVSFRASIHCHTAKLAKAIAIMRPMLVSRAARTLAAASASASRVRRSCSTRSRSRSSSACWCWRSTSRQLASRSVSTALDRLTRRRVWRSDRPGSAWHHPGRRSGAPDGECQRRLP
jgi:hypothetical protein